GGLAPRLLAHDLFQRHVETAGQLLDPVTDFLKPMPLSQGNFPSSFIYQGFQFLYGIKAKIDLLYNCIHDGIFTSTRFTTADLIFYYDRVDIL
ncbi:MAG TPA: hypothetical protein VES89_14260, partial [Candidatus Competibacteraceae bacterium]|nr:hypothetical protein [Candidatus Competibacteraceae bacterium]